MPLLTNELKQGGFSKPSGDGDYLYPGDITQESEARFTICGDVSVSGWSCWIEGPDKGIKLRFKGEPKWAEIEERAVELNGKIKGPGSKGGETKPEKFMAFAIYNYQDHLRGVKENPGKIQVFEFTQAGIGGPLVKYLSDDEIGEEPHTYDFKISAIGVGQDKRYTVTCLPGRRRKPEPNKQVEAAFQEALDNGFDLSRLWAAADPFKAPF